MSSVVGRYLWLYEGNTGTDWSSSYRHDNKPYFTLNYYTRVLKLEVLQKRMILCNAIAFVDINFPDPKSRIALIWDGASYHRSAEFKACLDGANPGLDKIQWKITCIRFAPNDQIHSRRRYLISLKAHSRDFTTCRYLLIEIIWTRYSSIILTFRRVLIPWFIFFTIHWDCYVLTS